MFYDIMYVSISERRCKMNFYNKPTNQVIDLSDRERKEFLDCFSFSQFTLRERRHKLIKYIKMFVGNQMAYSLYTSLRKININFHIFKFKMLRIKEKIFVLFYVDDFIWLIKVEEKSFDNNIYMEYYKNVENLNGYKLIYMFDDDLFSFDVRNAYIRFIIVKDDVVYVKNTYHYGDELDLSIENTTHESIKDGKFVYNELKVKTLGLSEEQIKNKLDSIFVMNTLKESC